MDSPREGSQPTTLDLLEHYNLIYKTTRAKERKKNILIALAIVICLFVITNPTTADFKQFIPTKSTFNNDEDGDFKKEKVVVSRESNYLLFSTFSYRFIEYDSHYTHSDHRVDKKVGEHSGRYFGIFNSFYEIE